MKLSVVCKSRKSMPRRAEILRPFLAVQMHDVGVGFPDILTGKVQEHAFASFRIFQDDASGIRQMQFHRVCDADGDEVMLEVELPQGGFIVLTQKSLIMMTMAAFFLGKRQVAGLHRK